MAKKLVKTGCDRYEWIEVPDEEIVPVKEPVLVPVKEPEPEYA